MDILGKLTAAEYWEWRTIINEMQYSELKLKYHNLVHNHYMKDIENLNLKSRMSKIEGLTLESDLKDHRNGYEEFKKKLEETHGFSMNNAVIDDVTFEVKKLD